MTITHENWTTIGTGVVIVFQQVYAYISKLRGDEAKQKTQDIHILVDGNLSEAMAKIEDLNKQVTAMNAVILRLTSPTWSAPILPKA